MNSRLARWLPWEPRPPSVKRSSTRARRKGFQPGESRKSAGKFRLKSKRRVRKKRRKQKQDIRPTAAGELAHTPARTPFFPVMGFKPSPLMRTPAGPEVPPQAMTTPLVSIPIPRDTPNDEPTIYNASVSDSMLRGGVAALPNNDKPAEKDSFAVTASAFERTLERKGDAVQGSADVVLQPRSNDSVCEPRADSEDDGWDEVFDMSRPHYQFRSDGGPIGELDRSMLVNDGGARDVAFPQAAYPRVSPLLTPPPQLGLKNQRAVRQEVVPSRGGSSVFSQLIRRYRREEELVSGASSEACGTGAQVRESKRGVSPQQLSPRRTAGQLSPPRSALVSPQLSLARLPSSGGMAVQRIRKELRVVSPVLSPRLPAKVAGTLDTPQTLAFRAAFQGAAVGTGRMSDAFASLRERTTQHIVSGSIHIDSVGGGDIVSSSGKSVVGEQKGQLVAKRKSRAVTHFEGKSPMEVLRKSLLRLENVLVDDDGVARNPGISRIVADNGGARKDIDSPVSVIEKEGMSEAELRRILAVQKGTEEYKSFLASKRAPLSNKVNQLRLGSVESLSESASDSADEALTELDGGAMRVDVPGTAVGVASEKIAAPGLVSDGVDDQATLPIFDADASSGEDAESDKDRNDSESAGDRNVDDVNVGVGDETKDEVAVNVGRESPTVSEVGSNAHGIAGVQGRTGLFSDEVSSVSVDSDESSSSGDFELPVALQQPRAGTMVPQHSEQRARDANDPDAVSIQNEVGVQARPIVSLRNDANIGGRNETLSERRGESPTESMDVLLRIFNGPSVPAASVQSIPPQVRPSWVGNDAGIRNTSTVTHRTVVDTSSISAHPTDPFCLPLDAFPVSPGRPAQSSVMQEDPNSSVHTVQGVWDHNHAGRVAHTDPPRAADMWSPLMSPGEDELMASLGVFSYSRPASAVAERNLFGQRRSGETAATSSKESVPTRAIGGVVRDSAVPGRAVEIPPTRHQRKFSIGGVKNGERLSVAEGIELKNGSDGSGVQRVGAGPESTATVPRSLALPLPPVQAARPSRALPLRSHGYVADPGPTPAQVDHVDRDAHTAAGRMVSVAGGSVVAETNSDPLRGAGDGQLNLGGSIHPGANAHTQGTLQGASMTRRTKSTVATTNAGTNTAALTTKQSVSTRKDVFTHIISSPEGYRDLHADLQAMLAGLRGKPSASVRDGGADSNTSIGERKQVLERKPAAESAEQKWNGGTGGVAAIQQMIRETDSSDLYPHTPYRSPATIIAGGKLAGGNSPQVAAALGSTQSVSGSVKNRHISPASRRAAPHEGGSMLVVHTNEETFSERRVPLDLFGNTETGSIALLEEPAGRVDAGVSPADSLGVSPGTPSPAQRSTRSVKASPVPWLQNAEVTETHVNQAVRVTSTVAPSVSQSPRAPSVVGPQLMTPASPFLITPAFSVRRGEA